MVALSRRMLSRFKLFKTHDEAIAVMCIIDSNDSGVIELDEILKYLDTIDDLFNNEDVAHVKMGFSGTSPPRAPLRLAPLDYLILVPFIYCPRRLKLSP